MYLAPAIIAPFLDLAIALLSADPHRLPTPLCANAPHAELAMQFRHTLWGCRAMRVLSKLFICFSVVDEPCR